jgi:outer membrane receptor protein involved in Fe transport
MLSNRNRGVSRAVALLCGLSATFATSLVYAQDTPPADDKTMDEVIVTGSRIARPNLESAVPVTTVTSAELFETGSTSVGDLLNDLPSLRTTFGQNNSSRFLGTTGLNLLDLRGLGTQRTLVLVNGRRHVASDILGNAVSPDTNTFPTDMIERIDVVTGGNSAVYGSDAIAGVVNFILKKDVEGVSFRGQGGQSSEGDAGDYYGSILAGTNFWDDRGNIAFNFEYAKQEPFFASDRDNLTKQGLFVVTDTDPSGADDTVDRLYYHDVRSVTIANGGSILFGNNAMAPVPVSPCGIGPNGVAYACSYLFQPDGSLIPETGTRIGLGPNGNFDGGNGTTNRERKALAIYPTLERYSFNVFGNLEISESFKPFIEAKYVRTDSLRWGSPAFFQGGTIDGDRELIRFDNPFLSDGARATMQAARLAAGFTTPYTDASQIALRRNLLDLGGRQEDATRETSRIVLGVGGEIGSGWNYEVALNYGKFKEDTEVLGNLNTQRFLLAMDSTRDVNGNIVCRSQIDPDAALIYPFSNSDAYATALLAGDVAACVPLNPFGDGSVTPAMHDYLVQDTTSFGKIEQFVASATLTGDSSAWFSLPAGPIGVAFGLEHRTEENFFSSDALVENGLTFYNALPKLTPPKFKVDEVFTEFRIPLLKEMTAAKELTLNLAARYADYDGDTGGVLAYNGGLEYSPIDSLRFRAGIARAVRAPNLVDLYSLQSQNFASVSDPCSANFIGTGSATRTANCAAAGIPADYNYLYTATLEIVSGGNPELKEETSDSFTAGVVFQPTFLPGFSFSADYFDIEIDDVITAPTAQDILNACYDGVDLNNQFCGLFQRAGAGGGPRGEQQFRVIEGGLQQTVLNYASSTARGIDFEVGYAHDVGEAGKVNARLVYTHTLERNDFLDPVNPGDADQILYELGDPKDAFNLNTDWQFGKFQFGYQMRWIGKMVLNFYEDTFSLQGNPPQNADYAEVRYYPSVFYHDIRAGFNFSDKLNAYVGVDNVANKVPPYGLTGTGAGSGIYESRGRFFYGGIKIDF